jgi:hypothetical protein
LRRRLPDNDGIHRVAAGDFNSVFRVPATPVEVLVMLRIRVFDISSDEKRVLQFESESAPRVGDVLSFAVSQDCTEEWSVLRVVWELSTGIQRTVLFVNCYAHLSYRYPTA